MCAVASGSWGAWGGPASESGRLCPRRRGPGTRHRRPDGLDVGYPLSPRATRPSPVISPTRFGEDPHIPGSTAHQLGSLWERARRGTVDGHL